MTLSSRSIELALRDINEKIESVILTLEEELLPFAFSFFLY